MLTTLTSVVVGIDEVGGTDEAAARPLTSRHKCHTTKTDRFIVLDTSWLGANFNMLTHIKGELLTTV